MLFNDYGDVAGNYTYNITIITLPLHCYNTTIIRMMVVMMLLLLLLFLVTIIIPIISPGLADCHQAEATGEQVVLSWMHRWTTDFPNGYGENM